MRGKRRQTGAEVRSGRASDGAGGPGRTADRSWRAIGRNVAAWCRAEGPGARTYAKFTIDLCLWALATPLAFALRLEAPLLAYGDALLTFTVAGVAIKGSLIYLLGLHRQSWRNVSFADQIALLRAIAAGTLLIASLGFLTRYHLNVPRSIPLIEAMLALILLGGVRALARVRHDGPWLARLGGPVQLRALIVGAGETGTMVARELTRRRAANVRPVGFVDDDPQKQRCTVLGLPVLGRIDQLARAVRRARADEILIAIPSAPGALVRQVTDLARQAGTRCRIIPSMYDILSGKAPVTQLRDVDLTDLLDRDRIELDLASTAAYLRDRVVLVTGAGGSIGSEIVRQILRFDPGHVLLLGRGENSLFQLERELDHAVPHLARTTLVADIRDRRKLAHLFAAHQPAVVFHAAAHKHVPLMELQPDEAVLNNVGGTKNLVDLSLEHGVERFVNISTDKAVDPTSVMGASKRVAEYLVEAASRALDGDRCFVSVRFGNVLGSRGSVVPLFQEQIRRGGPVTITHPDMTRYFKTIEEAAQLVVHAGGLGENGMVYVLDMGDPIRIVDLACHLIRLSGLEPEADIEIRYTGVRPGEKLHEELLTPEEGTLTSRHDKIFMANRTGIPLDGHLKVLVDQLLLAGARRDPEEIRAVFGQIVPNYRPEGMPLPKPRPAAASRLGPITVRTAALPDTRVGVVRAGGE